METKFWGYGFPFSSTLVFGEISDLARRDSKYRIQINCLGQITYLSVSFYLELMIVPSAYRALPQKTAGLPAIFLPTHACTKNHSLKNSKRNLKF